MNEEQQRLLDYLDKILTSIEGVYCDPEVSKEVKEEMYRKELEILDNYSFVEDRSGKL